MVERVRWRTVEQRQRELRDVWPGIKHVEAAYERQRQLERSQWFKSVVPPRVGYTGHGSSNAQVLNETLTLWLHWGMNYIEALHWFTQGVRYTPWSDFYAERLCRALAKASEMKMWLKSPSSNYLDYLHYKDSNTEESDDIADRNCALHLIRCIDTAHHHLEGFDTLMFHNEPTNDLDVDKPPHGQKPAVDNAARGC